MAGLIIQLIISWILVWIFEKGNLRFLGFKPTITRLSDFLIFFILTAICCSSGFLLRMVFAKELWQKNPAINASIILDGIWWNLRSVLYEELIFRGAILYILLRKTGQLKAILFSAAAFGIYHWFSFGIIGNIPQMILVFIVTGLMGFVLAYGYAKTFSLYVPVGIHFGWNLTHQFIFSQGPIGDGLLIQSVKAPFRTDSYLLFFTVILLPILSALLMNYLILRKKKQVVIAE